MDEDTAMWKEGVHVRSFMEDQKGKNILFERLFSRNKKINAITDVTENQYLTASTIGDKIVETLYLNRATSEKKRIRTLPCPLHSKLGCLLFSIGS